MNKQAYTLIRAAVKGYYHNERGHHMPGDWPEINAEERQALTALRELHKDCKRLDSLADLHVVLRTVHIEPSGSVRTDYFVDTMPGDSFTVRQMIDKKVLQPKRRSAR